MAIINLNNVGIEAISACVPENIHSNFDLQYLISENDIDKTINNIGIKEKRFVDSDICSSDLCYKAAEQIFNEGIINKSDIDLLIFISQTPDYRQPATAPSLQHRLGLKKTTMSFDINLACSGYVYGLSTAMTFASVPGINNVLLLVGETMSKTISAKDRVTYPLFGDAGTATIIKKDPKFGDSFFSLNSDGANASILQIPYGGYRKPSSLEGFMEAKDKEGNIRTGENLHMDGLEVFNFGLREVPSDIKRILDIGNLKIDDIDILLFHQANKFMTDFFAKKLKISLDKIPYCLDRYGNTSSASIPLTISSEFDENSYPNRKSVILSGFGAGLSWGTALLSLQESKILKVIEY